MALYHAGFADDPPDVAMIRQGVQPIASLAPDALAMLLWVDIVGVQAGDVLRFQLINLFGRVIMDREQSFARTQARRFACLGLRRSAAAWSVGPYVGTITLTRKKDDQLVQRSVTRTMNVE
jgi:hypothetical protein